MAIKAWDAPIGSSDSDNLITELVLTCLSRVSHPVGRTVEDLYRSRDFPSLVGFALDYGDLTANDALWLRQALAFFQKRPDLPLGIDTRAAAYAKFEESERLCKETNEIFRLWARGDFFFPRDVESVLFLAQRKIAQILGDLPPMETLPFRLGPGANIGVQRRTSSARRKFSVVPGCSSSLFPYVARLHSTSPPWVISRALEEQAPINEVEGGFFTELSYSIQRGRLSFVPKNARTDRPIVVEPLLNTYYQLGIGDYIARRLAHEGVNLKDQSRNKSLAREGSLTGALATLDLSSASDTISVELVYHLLPLDWAHALSIGRSPEVVGPSGEVIRLEKFSSMGNGYTFPLESLLFYALSWACCPPLMRGSVSVYGDDIIVPVSCYPLLTKVLVACGFSVNLEKSYAAGPFRESCGGDYFNGIDIRPWYLKNVLRPVELFQLHNFFVARYEDDLAAIVLKYIPEHLRLFGPPLYGDGHLHKRDFAPTRTLKSKGWDGFLFDSFSFRPRKDTTPLPGDYVFPSYSVYLSGGTAVSAPSQKRSGLWDTSVPGVKGYRRLSIYTLTV